MNAVNWKKMLPLGVAVAAFFVLALGYFSPVLEGKRLKQSDIVHYTGMAQEMQEHRAANEGDEPLWTGSMFSGMPGYQIGVVWPTNALTWLDSVFTGFLPRPASFVFLYLAGMFILLLCLRTDPWLALLGAIAYAFSSYFLVIIQAGHNSKAMAIGYMPMVLGGLYMLLRGRKMLGAALFALFLAMEVHANHVQVTYYLGMLLLLYVLAEVLRAVREKQVQDLLGRGVLAMVAVVFAVLCNMGLLWSTVEYGAYTTRGKSELTINAEGDSNAAIKTDGLDRDYVTHWSYGKEESLSLLVPDIKGGASGSLIQTREDLEKITDPALKKIILDKYQAGGYVNNYWGDQDFTSGPVYIGAMIVLLMLLLLVQAETRARWWMLASVPLVIILTQIGSPLLVGLLLIAYLLSGLYFYKDTLAYALFSAFVLTLLLSWGNNFMPLTDFFLDHVPGYNKFRAVTIILVIVELAAPVLAVLYLGRMVEAGKWQKAEERRFLITAGVLAFAVLVIALIPGSLFDFFGENEKAQLNAQMGSAKDGASVQAYITGLKQLRIGMLSTDAWRSFAFIILGGGLLFAFGRRLIGRNALLLGIGALVLVDLWGVDQRYVNNHKDEKGQYIAWENAADNAYPFKPQPADMAILQAEGNAATDADYEQALAKLKAGKAKLSGTQRMVNKEEETITRFGSLRRTTDFRVLGLQNPFQDTRVSYFHKSLGGYHGAKLERYQELIDFHLSPEIKSVIGAFGPGATMQTFDSVLAHQPVLNMLNTKYIIYANDKAPILNTHALGAAWFVGEVKEAKDANEEVTLLGTINPAKTAVVDARYYNELANAAKPDSTASVKLKGYRSNDLNYTVRSANGGVVVFSEIYYGPDWVAEIDGNPAPYVRADYVLRAMQVPAGEHTVRFHIVSKPFEVGGRIASISSFVLMLLVLLAMGWEFKRRGDPDSLGPES
ncbi:MAG: hypothetical protein IPN44_08770 [Flavobacteriales bacterium]|nr:hypothetical protein [Flavobacteriales bacterium]